MSKLKVAAASSDVQVPVEGGGSYIGTEPVQVPDTWYYRRQIRDGSLRLVADSERQVPADSAGTSLDKDTDAAPVANTTSKKAT